MDTSRPYRIACPAAWPTLRGAAGRQSLSLLCDAAMVFDKDGTVAAAARSSAVVAVPMPRRGVHVLAGESRYAWRHAVEPGRLCGERRVSVTLRRVVTVKR